MSGPGGDRTARPGRPRRPLARPMAGPLTRGRRLAGFGLALLGLPLVAAVAAATGLELTGNIPLFLAAVVAVALVGGLWPALVAAVGGFVLLNYFFVPPLHTLAIGNRSNLVGVTVFVVVAVAVSWVVDLAARRTRQADRAAAEARTLATIAGGVLRGADPLDALLRQLLDTFDLTSVTLLEAAPGGWQPAAVVVSPAADPADSVLRVPVEETATLVLRGPALSEANRRIVRAFAAQAVVALRQQRLTRAAEGDRVRTALLAAVGHDLRTPLASAKAAVAGLRSREVEFAPEDREELLATADESLDRLAGLVANLLDMSRLQAGTLGMMPADVGLEDMVPRALDELGPAGRTVVVKLPDDLPAVRADPGLLDRVLVNIVGNALRYSPPGRPPAVTGTAGGEMVELRVVDHGPGIPEEQWEQVFLPFQRLGDRHTHDGVGLGLALARGLTEAMGGTLRPAATPGGGLTMILTLPAAAGGSVAGRPE
ncbi:sensor histidine kinase [Paractinoplanes globisporus]|uniref:histidine kinase n=1 Tax=Paractinoplanes globisporus TaxID=113565 RepID=A0ABW6WT79_9ACTN